MAKSKKNEFLNKAVGSYCLCTVVDLICLNVVCLLAIKLALHFDYY